MNNRDVAFILREIGTYKELAGENPFKSRAFQFVSRTIETLAENIETIVKEGKLTEIKGVGKSLSKIIEEIVTQGTSTELEELKARIPEGIPELLELQGMGPKKVRAVWQKLGITSIGELEYACKENRLLTLEGFGEKSQAKILTAIEFKKKFRNTFLIHEALVIAKDIITLLEKSNQYERAVIAGSLRRGKKYVKDADILVVPKKDAYPEQIKEILVNLADNPRMGDGVISAGSTKVSIRRHGLQVDFRIIESGSFAPAYQHFTGSKEHNTLLRTRAKSLGLKMNEYGVFKEETPLPVKDEQEVYANIGLAWIPPEIREGDEEIDAAEKNELPVLIDPEDIKGMIHIHSSYSDGTNSIEELARECIRLGYSYLCLTDHSRTAFYAGGLKPEQLHAQREEVNILNKRLTPFKIFCGIESDILADGSLDYPDEILHNLDFVIGSVHSRLNMNKEEATARLLAAMKNPYLTILGHISGRLLLSREGYPFDEEKILSGLKEYGVVLEHNCNPHRLDPDWDFMKKAAHRSIRISLGSDAHSLDGFRDIHFGWIMARKAWLEKKDILNCMTGEEIDEYFRKRKAGKGT
ncbi:MAG: DNA polymerase/3'-5' exonuclease PolX [Spirochaetales bacterium]|nr:DNA polymerase/3'-5' exonuclease PolX [Spirochaetales bacterium]